MSKLDAIRDFISRRRNAYTLTFLTPNGGKVLEDLAKFCRAHESCFYKDARAHAVAEGRREVWLRIQKQLHLTDEQLWALHSVTPPTPIRSDEND